MISYMRNDDGGENIIITELDQIQMIMIQGTDIIIPVNQIIGIESREWIKENGDLVVLSVVVLHIFEGDFP